MNENLSGAFDYERQRFEEEQALLRADPQYAEWLEFIDWKQKHADTNHSSAD